MIYIPQHFKVFRVFKICPPLEGARLVAHFVRLGILTLLHFTVFGRRIYLYGSNNMAAAVVGISPNAIVISAYTLSGVFSSLAGLLELGTITIPNFQVLVPYTIPALVAVIIGGVSFRGGEGSYIGVIAGVVVLQLISSLLSLLSTSQAIREIAYGLTLLLVVAAYTGRRRE